MSEIITVQNVIPAAAGKKQGKVIDTQNRSWQIWADKAHMFQIGQSYEILKADSKQFNGATYVTISEFRPVGGALPNVGTTPTPPTGSHYSVPVTPTAPQAAPAQYIATPPIATSEAERRMDIFICGAVNNWLANANTDINHTTPADVIRFVTMMKEVWKRTLGPNADQYTQPVAKQPSQPRPSTEDEMSDSIPF